MAQNFVACDRDQELLLPPSLREWLPEGHLAWFVIDAVATLDLSAFLVAYRVDGHGRPAHDPVMMVALLLYGYAIGERSSRRLERRCVEDVATRVICAKQAPDHTTIARFRQRHEVALAELFGEVLALCAEAGLVRVGVIAVDGTKVAANAAPQATRDYRQIAREILAEADAVDAEEDAQFGDARGDELPPETSTAQGRRGWLRDAKRRLDDKRAAEARPIPRDRPERRREAKRRSKKSTTSSARPTPLMRPTGRAASTRTARGSDGRRSRSRHRRRPRARSTSVTWIRGTSRRHAAGCRAITPKSSAPKTRSSSPPK
jgi:transposase